MNKFINLFKDEEITLTGTTIYNTTPKVGNRWRNDNWHVEDDSPAGYALMGLSMVLLATFIFLLMGA